MPHHIVHNIAVKAYMHLLRYDSYIYANINFVHIYMHANIDIEEDLAIEGSTGLIRAQRGKQVFRATVYSVKLATVKNISTKRFSLERAVAWILEKYVTLQSYFHSEGITCHIISMYVLLFLAMQMS